MLLTSCLYILVLLIKSGIADSDIQQAIKAFTKFNAINCHILLFTYSDLFYEQKVLLDFYKAVSKDTNKATAVENINHENRKNDAISSKRLCAKPLRTFIFGNVKYISKYMLAEKRRENIIKDLWLLFVKNDFEQKLILSELELSMRSDVYIARRTTDGYKFWEIYRAVQNESVRVIYYGDWNADTGLTATEPSILARRRDFGGAAFRYAKFEAGWYSEIHDSSHANLLIAVWQLLEKDFNFTTRSVIIRENSFNHSLDNDLQNIFTKMLASNEVDVYAAELSLRSSSRDDVDYSVPLLETISRVYMKKSDVDFQSWFHFFHSMPLNAWYCIIVIALISPVIIMFMHRIRQKAGATQTQYYFSDICIELYQILCGQGGTLQQDFGSINLLLGCISLCVFLIRTIYSGALASILAIQKPQVPFSSLDGLLANGQYKFGVHRYGPEFDIFYKSNNQFFNELNKAVMDQNISNLPTSYLEGLQRVCSDEKYTFMMSTRKVLELQSKLSCQLYSLPQEQQIISTVFTVSKQNEYLPFINQRLEVLDQIGLLGKFRRDIIGSGSSDLELSESVRSIELEDTVILQLLLVFTVVLSIVILSVEMLYSKTEQNRRAKYC